MRASRCTRGRTLGDVANISALSSLPVVVIPCTRSAPRAFSLGLAGKLLRRCVYSICYWMVETNLCAVEVDRQHHCIANVSCAAGNEVIVSPVDAISDDMVHCRWVG